MHHAHLRLRPSVGSPFGVRPSVLSYEAFTDRGRLRKITFLIKYITLQLYTIHCQFCN